jgi:hypothetical protein
VPEEIRQRLEEIPEDVKTVFRTIQAREELEEPEHGDHIALYNSDGTSRNEHRWIRMGRYDEIEGKVRAEYFMKYETASRKLGATIDFSAIEPGTRDSKLVKVPERQYENASDSLHEIL